MWIDGGILEVLCKFLYLGVVIDINYGCRKKMESLVAHGRKVGSVIKALIRKKTLSMNVVRVLYKRTLVSILL